MHTRALAQTHTHTRAHPRKAQTRTRTHLRVSSVLPRALVRRGLLGGVGVGGALEAALGGARGARGGPRRAQRGADRHRGVAEPPPETYRHIAQEQMRGNVPQDCVRQADALAGHGKAMLRDGFRMGIMYVHYNPSEGERLSPLSGLNRHEQVIAQLRWDFQH